MSRVELYTHKCQRCQKTFRTPDLEQYICSDCLKREQPHHKTRKKTAKTKPLTFAEILHIAEVYNKIHHKYLHYGDIVNLINSNPKQCICCGAALNKNKHVCDKCKEAKT